VFFSFPAMAQQPCLKKAWEAFDRSAYTEAVDAASDCIDRFSARAQRDEGILEAAHEKEPLTGGADNAFDRKKIFDRWAVNDVATAYYIRGQAAEQLWKLHKKQQLMTMARESYAAAQRLRYGRCWDPQGWFWSPAEAASDRLLALK
jgi:hypothetical protein